MKFLCVPCDTPMKLETVDPPERGSLSVVYSCPECGYEIAMLTNAFETQIVQSLGVRIGPQTAEASAEAGSRCPFGTMIPATPELPNSRTPELAVRWTAAAEAPAGRASAGGEARVQSGEPIPVRWTSAAEARLENIPGFVRPMARTGIERFAQEKGAAEVDEKILDAAREFFGM